jgi:hypothetical protein
MRFVHTINVDSVFASSPSARFTPFFALIALMFAFVAIALSAFQVVVGASGSKDALTSTGYWFSIATLVVLACVSFLTLVWFAMLMVDNMATAIAVRMKPPALNLHHVGG